MAPDATRVSLVGYLCDGRRHEACLVRCAFCVAEQAMAILPIFCHTLSSVLACTRLRVCVRLRRPPPARETGLPKGHWTCHHDAG
jgi:hypothetical protein